MTEPSTTVPRFTNKTKYIFTAIFGLIIGFMISMGFNSCNNKPMTIIDQKAIAADVTRSHTIVVDNLQEELRKSQSNYTEILKDMESLKAQLTVFQTISTSTPGKIVTGSKSDYIEPVKPNPGDISPTDSRYTLDPFGYLSSRQTINLHDTFGTQEVKIGEASFSGFSEKPWSYTISPKTYSVTTVLGKTDDDKQVAYNTFTVEVDGKKYSLPITSTLMQEKNQDRFYWWNPKFGIGLAGGVSNKLDGVYSASVMFTPLSYGERKTPTWLFAGIGASIGNTTNPNLVISPVSFNLGKITNVTHNTYIGPQLHTNFTTHSLQLGIMVTF